ncbi:MAG: MmgE/PrpD family protein, partial [Chloroflexota bacterium]|nr:MmgE/PrpD family protein [Chloroflexota bacterium]
MALASVLARHIVRTEFSDLPPETVEVTKRSILDTMGVILAASTLEDGCRAVVSLVKEAGGKAESSILAFGGKVPCGMAAFANGSMTHALDYDDTA